MRVVCCLMMISDLECCERCMLSVKTDITNSKVTAAVKQALAGIEENVAKFTDSLIIDEQEKQPDCTTEDER